MTNLEKMKAGWEHSSEQIAIPHGEVPFNNRKSLMNPQKALRGLVAGLLLPCLLTTCLALSGCVHRMDSGWREYKVFCGMSFKNGEVTDAAWQDFCDEHVTTAFPDGYTSFEATGYWKGSATTTTRENSRVLLIIAPADAKDKVMAIARQYHEQFQQEAVLVMTSTGEALFVEDGP